MIFFLEMVRGFMDEIEKSLQNWGQQLENVHLPRWHELPMIIYGSSDYSDRKILIPIDYTGKHTLLTSSMVNSYVKHGLIRPQ